MRIIIDHEPKDENDHSCREEVANYLDQVTSDIRRGNNCGEGWELQGEEDNEE
jgi:hypothetical protein